MEYDIVSQYGFNGHNRKYNLGFWLNQWMGQKFRLDPTAGQDESASDGLSIVRNLWVFSRHWVHWIMGPELCVSGHARSVTALLYEGADRVRGRGRRGEGGGRRGGGRRERGGRKGRRGGRGNFGAREARAAPEGRRETKGREGEVRGREGERPTPLSTPSYILVKKSFAPIPLISLYFKIPIPVDLESRKWSDQAQIFRDCFDLL